KTEDGGTMYYAEILNRKSKFVWWMDHPAAADLGISGTPNWGGDQTVTFDTLSTKLTVTSAVGTFTAGETVTDAAAVTVTPAGSGATAGTITFNAGAVQNIPVGNGGNGYLSAPNVVITGDGTGATATATVSAGHVTGVTIISGGTGYTSATAT